MCFRRGIYQSELGSSSFQKSHRLSKLRKWLENCQFSITLWICLAFVTLTVNIITTVLVVMNFGFDEGSGILIAGSCQRIQNFNTGIHVLINFLSTSLLAGSNFCMQCLSAPSRQEVDQAHLKSIALDIGCPSFRNLRYVKRRKLVCWMAFGLSSLPLHLFYNSLIYSSIAVNYYNVIVAGPRFIDPAQALETLNSDLDDKSLIEPLRTQFLNNELNILDPVECIKKYARDYVSANGNLIIVSNSSIPHKESPKPLDYSDWGSYQSFSEWMCGKVPPTANDSVDTCYFQVSQLIKDPVSLFRPLPDNSIMFCAAQEVPEDCKLMFSLPIALTVVILNAIKIIVMLSVASFMETKPLLTIGDALMSFLKAPSLITKRKCLYKAIDFERDQGLPMRSHISWEDRRSKWYTTPGWLRWCQLTVLLTPILVATIKFETRGIEILGTILPTRLDAFKLGLGSVKLRTILTDFGKNYPPFAFMLLVNLPQIFLSITYFAYNSILTIMLTGKEWTDLALNHKGLRVSLKPQGEQRSTCFLQLPYLYGIPLVISSGILHWLVSESLFLVGVNRRDFSLDGTFRRHGDGTYHPRGDPSAIYSLGWSPLGLLLTIILTVILGAFIFALCFRNYSSGMPPDGTNSLVLAAACHPQNVATQKDLPYRKLKWGVVSNLGAQVYSDIGHCALSSEIVEYPKLGSLYA